MRTSLTLRPPRAAPRAALVLAAVAALGTARAAVAQGDAATPDGDRAAALFEARRYAEAKPLLEREAKKDPRDARAPYLLGRIAAVEGDFEGAARWLERAVRLAPDEADRHYHLGIAHGQVAQRGSRLRAFAPAKRCRASLERAVELDPRHLDARLALVRFHLAAPRLVGGSVRRAREHARAIAGASEYRGMIAEGALREDARDWAKASAAYHAAARLHPDSAAAWYALGLMHQRAGHTAEAFDAFERAALANEVETAALYAIGRLAALTGERTERGEEALRRYLATPPVEGSPPLSSAHFRLGTLLERRGRRDLARREYEAALRLEPRGEVREALARVR
jgi:tetratricopeptide (TPR) repeat protein